MAVSASTLAEDVRQLAKWCRSADDAREQQERRLEQLESMPPLQSQLKALQDKACPLPTMLLLYTVKAFRKMTGWVSVAEHQLAWLALLVLCCRFQSTLT